MLNRIAEALFWTGRYAERAENHARLIDVHYHIRERSELEDDHRVWMRIIGAVSDPDKFLELYPVYSERDVLHYITLDINNTNSLLSCVSQARLNLRSVREKVPCELWESLNGFYLWLKEKQVEHILIDSPFLFYRKIKEQLAMFHGIAGSTMLRDELWSIMESGKYLERAENSLRILKSVAAGMNDSSHASYGYMQTVLKSVGGYEQYRRMSTEELKLETIVGFLILAESFPRSIHFAYSSLEENLQLIRREGRGEQLHDKALRLATKQRIELAYLERDAMSGEGLEALLAQLLDSTNGLGEAMASTFFQYGEGASA
ncbi:alpha-E domain-containing protein [Paenibacillus sp. y28]|uniref:alpha-E domain-containing protein n=1 Tax=Paenibacillus sp. y28 TaxID=3129110 RepID=UPI003018C977